MIASLKRDYPDTIIRIATRNVSDLYPNNALLESVQFDFNYSATFSSAVKDCTSLFLLRPPAISNTKATLNRLIDVARKAEIRNIVFLSVAGAADNKIVPHHAVEQHLKNGPDDWTILRPGFFAQNLSSAYRRDIIEDSRIFVPAGSGKVAFVDLRDVGEVAADALTSISEQKGKIYTLTGPKSYSFYDAARILTKNLGRKIEYKPASIPGYIFHLIFKRKQGVMHSVVQTILHVGLRYGQAEETDPTLEKLLNRAPNHLESYIEDHSDLWEK